MHNHLTTIMMGGFGIVLYLMGLLFPIVGSKGPNSWVGIRTGSNNDPKVWELMHVKSEVPLLGCGYFLFMAIYLFLHLNIDMSGANSMLLMFLCNIPVFIALLASVSTEGACKKLAEEGKTGEDIKPEMEASFDRLYSAFLYFTLFLMLIVVLFLVTAGENGVEGHTGLRIEKALESAESWKEVQSKALTANLSFLVLFIGNFFFRRRNGKFRRMLVLGNMVVLCCVVGWYYFL